VRRTTEDLTNGQSETPLGVIVHQQTVSTQDLING
jgi:hypothetical protein